MCTALDEILFSAIHIIAHEIEKICESHNPMFERELGTRDASMGYYLMGSLPLMKSSKKMVLRITYSPVTRCSFVGRP